jgi:predicted amidohydrolase YtcJ
VQVGLAARGVDLHGAASREEALDRVARHAATSSDPIVLGYGWDESTWSPPRPFTRAEVDRAAGGRPAYLARVDVHSAIVSTALVEHAPQVASLPGWSADGRVERESHHAARDAANGLVTAAMRTEAIRYALREAAARGIGLVHELGAPHLSHVDDFRRIAEISEAEAVPDVVCYWGEPDAYELAAEHGCRGLAGDLCVDGAIGSRTAALHDPYDDADTRGHCYLDEGQVRDHVVGCTRHGLQAGFHAIGDRGVDTVLAGFRAAADQLGAAAVVAAGHRLEHAEMIDEAGVSLLAELGVTASVQPAFDAAWGGRDGLYGRRLGDKRASGMNPFRAMAEAGVTLAFGSDSPVTPLDPWAGVRAAAWHQTPSQRISVEAAFAAHTRGGWRAAGEDAGWLAAGMPATYAVWDVPGGLASGLPELHPDRPLPTCTATVVAGATVHARDGAHP